MSYKYCQECGKTFNSLGFARHRTMHSDRREKEYSNMESILNENDWFIERDKFQVGRFHIIDSKGKKIDYLGIRNETIRKAWDLMHHRKMNKI